jgi:hypothetical protein
MYSFSIRQFVRLYSAVEKIQGLQVFVVGLNIIYDPLVFEGEGGVLLILCQHEGETRQEICIAKQTRRI